MDWKQTQIPAGGKLFKVHNFNFLFKGVNFHLEVDEFSDGSFTAHGEQANDKSNVIESVNGKSIDDCLSSILKKIQGRAK